AARGRRRRRTGRVAPRASRLPANKLADAAVRAPRRQFADGRALGPVAVPAHEAQEAERLGPRGAELVPGQGGYVHEAVERELVDLAAHEGVAPAPDHHDRVDVVVALERRVPAVRDLEVAQLGAGLLAAPEQDLAGGGLEMSAVVLPLGTHRDVLPPEGRGLAQVGLAFHRV